MNITKENIIRYNQELRDKSPDLIVQWALNIAKRPILTTNFGPYSASLIHLVHQEKNDIKVICCDTGYNTSYTTLFAENITEKLDLNLYTYYPRNGPTKDEFITKGIPSIENPKHQAFTEHVKLEPFRRAMQEHKPDVWFTNLRKGQTLYRDSLDILSLNKDGVLKVSPFHYWNDDRLSSYLSLNGLPNETRYFDPTKVSQNRECGLHV